MNRTILDKGAEIFDVGILRKFFYLGFPSESSFPTVEAVPNYLLQAAPWLVCMVFLEALVLKMQGKEDLLYFSDSFTSVSSAMLQSLAKMLHARFFILSVDVGVYVWIYNNYRLANLPWDSPLTWIAALVTVDFCYYWFHRMGHEIAIMWAIHQTHHSSEFYTISTGVRQGMFQQYTSMWFYLLGAFFIPPSLFVAHYYFHQMYQIWIHTQTIDKFPAFIEAIFCTPSHHRVHHGRNPYCMDKNYGGTLIIFDKMFGTFQEEKADEKIAYGLVKPVKSYDALYVQAFYLRDVILSALNRSTLLDKVKTIFYSPAWKPGLPRMPYFDSTKKLKKPPVPFKKAALSSFLKIYLAAHIIILVILMARTARQKYILPIGELLTYASFTGCSLVTLSNFPEHKSYAWAVELVRCALVVAYLYVFGQGSIVLTAAYVISLMISCFFVTEAVSLKIKTT